MRGEFNSHYSKISIIPTVKGRSLSHRAWPHGKIEYSNKRCREGDVDLSEVRSYSVFLLFGLKTLHIYLLFFPLFYPTKSNYSFCLRRKRTYHFYPWGSSTIVFCASRWIVPSLWLRPQFKYSSKLWFTSAVLGNTVLLKFSDVQVLV